MKSAEPTDDEQVRPEARLPLAQLPLEPDRAAERRRRDRAQNASPGRARLSSGSNDASPALPRSCAMPPAPSSSSSSSSLARERLALGRRLHLDEPAVARHDDVHVDLGASSPRRSRGRAAARRRRCRPRRLRPSPASARESPKRSSARAGGDVGAGDRGAARAAVGLEDVAVEPDRPLAERLEVDDAREARGRSAAGSRPCARPACPRDASRCVRSPVEAGSSEYSAVSQPRPWPYSQRGTPPRPIAVQSTFVLPCDVEHRAVRLLEEVDADLERPQLVGSPAVAASRGRPRARRASTCSTSAIGSWRKRAPDRAEGLRRRRS